jgi:hypothetical protein
MTNDDALAPVIAVMLILAIAVTVFAVYTSTYLPGLKQQAEVEHFKEVESGFTKFSSDIDLAFTLAKSQGGNLSFTLSEQIPLGGGDIELNTLKSGGNIRVQEEPLGYLTVDNTTIFISGPDNHPAGTPIPLKTVNYAYMPDHNFWVNKSYIWDHGFVTVSQWPKTAPLNYDSTMNGIMDQNLVKRINFYSLNDSSSNFISLQGTTLTIIQMNSSSSNNQVSGNGIGTLELKITNTTDSILQTSVIPSGIVNFANPDGSNTTLISGQPGQAITLRIINITVEAN